MWVDRCVESTGGEQTRGRCALHCLGRVRGDEGGWAWCSLWVVMLMRMQDALGSAQRRRGRKAAQLTQGLLVFSGAF